jgi:prophage antirepressor-like protein
MSFEEMAENAKSPNLPTEFKFDESPVRAVIKDGEPWFIAKDVCEILEILDPAWQSDDSTRMKEVPLVLVRQQALVNC